MKHNDLYKKISKHISVTLIVALLVTCTVPMTTSFAAQTVGEPGTSEPVKNADNADTAGLIDNDEPFSISTDVQEKIGEPGNTTPDPTTESPEPPKGYQITEKGQTLAVTYNGNPVKNTYLLIIKTGDVYSVISPKDTASAKNSGLYYFDAAGNGSVYKGTGLVTITYEGGTYPNYYVKSGKISMTAATVIIGSQLYKVSATGVASPYNFTGVYQKRYYNSGKLGTAKAAYYRVYNNYLYKISANGNASVYIKNKKKSGNYLKSVSGIYYNVSYKNGKVSKYTGVYKGKYYKSGKLGTAKGTYYKVYKSRLYKVAKNGKASVYIKSKKKSGSYLKLVDKVCYSVSYKKGKASKYTGLYKTRYYSKGKPSSKTGWVKIKGKKYYLKKGIRVTGTMKIKGKYYSFSGSGALLSDQTICRKAQKYSSKTKWLILVNKSKRKVAVFYGSKGKWNRKHYWSCTIGAPSSPTPGGTYTVGAKGRSFGTSSYTCWYYTQFRGDYLFHSVLYRPGSMSSITDGRLGIAASHGCVRLKLSNAKWIYKNIPRKTKVIVY